MTTTAQAFAGFLGAVSPTDAQKQDVASKRDSTGRYLRQAFPGSGDLPVDRVVLIGSADRGTLIRPVDDVDVMAQFTNKDGVFEKYRYASGDFLQRIRRALDARTSIKRIGARGQAVRLFYVSGAHVDIAPVFKWSGGGYALPDGSGGWITTDPEEQARWYADRKKTVGQNLSSVVKLAKRWNVVHSGRLESYHLEVMVASMFRTVGSNHRDALKCFFDWAPSWLGISDPAGHSGRLDGYLTNNSLSSLRARFSQALDRATRALAQEAAGNHAEAKRLWKVELGSDFPAG